MWSWSSRVTWWAPVVRLNGCQANTTMPWWWKWSVPQATLHTPFKVCCTLRACYIDVWQQVHHVQILSRWTHSVRQHSCQDSNFTRHSLSCKCISYECGSCLWCLLSFLVFTIAFLLPYCFAVTHYFKYPSFVIQTFMSQRSVMAKPTERKGTPDQEPHVACHCPMSRSHVTQTPPSS